MLWNINLKTLNNMAENKKSFLFYCDWTSTFKALPKEKGYDLLIHLLDYVNDKHPETDDVIINAVFPIMENQLKRDLKKWEDRSEINKINGKKGGRPKAKKPNGLNGNQTEPKKADKDIVIDKDIVKDINKRKAEFSNSLSKFLGEYSADLLNDFLGYWTEHGENDKKMRFEKETSFSLGTRLARWKINQEKWLKSTPKSEKINAGTLLKQKYGL